MRTHTVVTCHRCGHEWAYMGSKIERVLKGLVHRVWCRCGANVRLRRGKSRSP